jgi:hypothetical protein
MKCSCVPLRNFCRALRFMIFPKSKEIELRTKKLEQALEELRKSRQETSQAVKSVTQPDVLRSLVISMNSVGRRK